MPSTLQSEKSPESTGRSIGAPALFASLPAALQTELRGESVRRCFSDGQIVQQRGDAATGFWIIETGQVKFGHYAATGEMQVLMIMGSGDSFGELPCLGHFPRVLDGEAIGAVEMLWVSENILTATITRSPEIALQMLGAMAQQLQEALDMLIVYRNMPAAKRLAQSLLALGEGKPVPVTLTIRQQELAELVGVSRMTIASTLAQMEELGLVSRHYRHLVINDPKALRRWMKS